jgi:hypothetical protein
MLKETKEDLNKWNNILCLWFRRLNIVKMPILCKLTCGVNEYLKADP